MEVALKDGRTLTGATSDAKGSSTNPLTRRDVEEKALDKNKKGAPGKVDPKAQAIDPKLAKKAGKGAAATPDPNAPQKDDPDAPLLDMSDVAVRKMVTKAKQRGYVTYDELNRVLPSDKVS